MGTDQLAHCGSLLNGRLPLRLGNTFVHWALSGFHNPYAIPSTLVIWAKGREPGFPNQWMKSLLMKHFDAALRDFVA
jgi:hypothetical protein